MHVYGQLAWNKSLRVLVLVLDYIIWRKMVGDIFFLRAIVTEI